MKKSIYVLAVTLVIATLVISSTATISVNNSSKENDNKVNDYEPTPQPLATKTSYLSIPAAAFIPTDNIITYGNSGWYLYGVGVTKFYAPVFLPHKAKVTKVTFYWKDTLSPGNGWLQMKRSNMDEYTDSMTDIILTSGPGDGSSYDDTIDYADIDNSLHTYYLTLSLPDYRIGCYGVIIEYNYEPVSIPVNKINNKENQIHSIGVKNPVIYPQNGDSFIQRLKRLLTGEIIDVDISDSANINPSKINGTISTSTDIATGIIPYDNNPPYQENIGFTVDVSSKIPSGFTLIEVTAKGRKAHQMTGEIQDEAPLILYPTVNGTSIEILIWDADKDEYGGAGWPNMKASIEYTLFMEK